ncbi:MAG: alpha-amylase family glycosyl hydrolase [Armatimonadota bacterium]
MSRNDNWPALQMEFHVSRAARDRYQFDQALFALSGNVVFANFHGARIFAQKMNAKRDLARFPELAVRAGQLNALGLIDEILHYVFDLYRQQVKPGVMAQALETLDAELGVNAVNTALHEFTDAFPPVAVYRREISLDAYLAGETSGVPHRQLVLEEMVMLWLANLNPATAPFMELFDDAALEKTTAYPAVMEGLYRFFAAQPPFGPDHQQLIDMLRSPAVACPHSLSDQLEYILSHWGGLMGKFLYRLLSGLDLIKEEEKAIFGGPGPSLVYDYAGMQEEPEQFSADKDWMPRVVLLAKNTYVWLDQLSKQYGRHIHRLDQIPDEELDRLARRGFTGLWLIGLWERSPASARIKQMMGNPDAVASAYSVSSYDPAQDLGGEEALETLRARAWERGLRLASDMVPNHVGIDSPWVINHPDWFVQLPYSPFPAYTFNGPNLSWDERVGIFIEDHYYDRSDAAVVFMRVDYHAGEARFIYHGNDGTNMPWNDTAQLNYLIPAVREAVIQTILHVARNFPIIRFDAAMTLAKKHYQRLWFPEPGSGGAIPSRAEHGMTWRQFNEVFPVEFWREVVDRVAQEAPDTLLLAEAFWLMEGYFVRTLGMHRVYNSAFMNMLRDEENGNYRSVMKNTLEFDPEVLKRFVNFMNNPDERTAVEQFGKGDKYFGICVLMSTLPGLPMFGHGQIEGYEEKYGMEYRRAYRDEQVDGYLVERHEREIFPLLYRRQIFSGVSNFQLYDFYAPEGHVNEDVFAYSNRAGEARGLVLYHNKFADCRGWIRISAASLVKGADGEKTLQQRSLGEGLGLSGDADCYVIYRDSIRNMEFIRNSRELCERGLLAELGAYQYYVFLDFREVRDDATHRYANLCSYLNGRGVPSIEEAMREVFLQPVHGPYKELVNAGMFRYLLDSRGEEPNPAALDEAEEKMQSLLRAVKDFTGGNGDEAAIAREVREELEAALQLAEPLPPYLTATRLPEDDWSWYVLFGWLFTHALGRMSSETDPAGTSRAWTDEWLLGRILAGALTDLENDDDAAWWATGLVKLLTAHQGWSATKPLNAYNLLTGLLSDADVRHFLRINRHQDMLWFNSETFDELLGWLLVIELVQHGTDAVQRALPVIEVLYRAKEASGYQIEGLLDEVEKTLAV